MPRSYGLSALGWLVVLLPSSDEGHIPRPHHLRPVMPSPAIDKYYTSVQKIKDWGGSNKETAIRQAFITLLNNFEEKNDLRHTLFHELISGKVSVDTN